MSTSRTEDSPVFSKYPSPVKRAIIQWLVTQHAETCASPRLSARDGNYYFTLKELVDGVNELMGTDRTHDSLLVHFQNLWSKNRYISRMPAANRPLRQSPHEKLCWISERQCNELAAITTSWDTRTLRR